jgi:hypothetical protein
MTGGPTTCRHSYQLAENVWITFRLEGGVIDAVLSPACPPNRQQLLPAYRAARNDFLSKLGLPALVVEL